MDIYKVDLSKISLSKKINNEGKLGANIDIFYGPGEQKLYLTMKGIKTLKPNPSEKENIPRPISFYIPENDEGEKLMKFLDKFEKAIISKLDDKTIERLTGKKMKKGESPESYYSNVGLDDEEGKYHFYTHYTQEAIENMKAKNVTTFHKYIRIKVYGKYNPDQKDSNPETFDNVYYKKDGKKYTLKSLMRKFDPPRYTVAVSVRPRVIAAQKQVFLSMVLNVMHVMSHDKNESTGLLDIIGDEIDDDDDDDEKSQLCDDEIDDENDAEVIEEDEDDGDENI